MKVIDKNLQGWRTRRSELNREQKVLLAFNLQSLVKRRWFGVFIDPPPDHGFCVLLLVLYAFGTVGDGKLSKRSTWELMKGVDIKTARRHMVQAEALGLIRISQSKEDKRVDLVEPTELLNFMVEEELMQFFDEMREMMYRLLEHPLPETRAPVLKRVRTKSQSPKSRTKLTEHA